MRKSVFRNGLVCRVLNKRWSTRVAAPAGHLRQSPHRRPLPNTPRRLYVAYDHPQLPHISGRWRRIGSAVAATAALALAGLGTAVHANAATTDAIPAAHKMSTKAIAAQVAKAHVQYTKACAATPKKGYAACHALRVTGGTTAFMEKQAALKGSTPKTVKPNAASDAPTGYGPSDIQSAYGLTNAAASNGSGKTVAIVDANDDPNAEADLATYRDQYGLSACTTANGCFKKVSQTGSTTSLPRRQRLGR